MTIKKINLLGNLNYPDVILVDDKDNETGRMEKMEAHQKGMLHRAFSILIFNSKGEMLLQKRALTKYHSGGLWTNTCCSHPEPGETILEAGKRRLKEEMDLDCDLEKIYSFIYKVELNNNLIEHELDHVLIGFSNGNPKLNKDEASEYKWISINEIQKELENNPNLYTFWFKEIIKNGIERIEEIVNNIE